MDIGKYLKEKKPVIDRELERAFPRKLGEKWLQEALGKAAYKYDADAITKSMAEPIWDLLDRGGKRWRPALAMLACEAVGGKEKDVLPFTPLVELIHSGTLLCDDIEDDSKKRRGKPCTHLIYGVDVAVNDGCALYFIPLIALYRNKQKLGAGKIGRIYNLYAEEMLRVSVGQATDILWHKGAKERITEQEYLQMVANKTGVLARFAAKFGGLLGEGSKGQVDALGRFGEALGIGFQIRDDVLELTEERFKEGKGSAGGDIHEGKRTLLVIKTLGKASEADRKRLVEILNSHPSDAATIEEAIAIIKKYGAVEYARKKANSIVERGWKELEKKLPKSDAKRLLHELAQFAMTRDI